MPKKIILLIFLIIFGFLIFSSIEKDEILASPSGCWGTGGLCNLNCRYSTRTKVQCNIQYCSEPAPYPSGGSGYTFSGLGGCSSVGAGSCYIMGGNPRDCYTGYSMGGVCYDSCYPDYKGFNCSSLPPALCTECPPCRWDSIHSSCSPGWVYCSDIPKIYKSSCTSACAGGNCVWLTGYWVIPTNPTTVYDAGTQCNWYTEPKVDTLDATAETETSATLNGNITNTGGVDVNVVERGFDWGTSPGVYTNSWTETGSFGTGTFDSIDDAGINHAIGLNPWTTYYFRAKARNFLGWGYGNEKSFKTLDTTPPQVSVIGAPAVWQNTDACAGINCTDAASGCDTGSFKFKVIPYTPTSPNCSTYNYDTGYSFPTPDGCIANQQKVSSHSWVCGAAKDNAGNTGFSSPVEFRIDKDKPISEVASPVAGSWYKDDFSVTLRYSDSGGSGLGSCFWKVTSAGTTTLDWTLAGACSGNGPVDITNTVTVGPGEYCRDEGQNTCTVYVKAVDNAQNSGDMAIKSFSISWSAPITKIKCDGVEGCPESPYLNSVTIELVCQPGATECLGTYYCVDQTNTCNPNPCSP